MLEQENKPLGKLNTFRVNAKASYYKRIDQPTDIYVAYEWLLHKKMPYYILGGGSNILLTSDVKGLIIHVNLRGIEVDELPDAFVVKVAAGENWNELVNYCLKLGINGLENLVLIPGTAGAAPVQNIGAYGMELEEVFHSLEAFDMMKGEMVGFEKSDCGFSYRNSRFKSQDKGRFLITKVVLKLPKAYELRVSYTAVEQWIKNRAVKKLHAKKLAEAISEIRRSKLPDPEKVPNAGSFFKNPVVSPDEFRDLQKLYPDMVHYEQPDGNIKIAAGWLIDKLGWKGKVNQGAAVHRHQALVIINQGTKNGRHIWLLAEKIRADVYKNFKIMLEPEVNIWP